MPSGHVLALAVAVLASMLPVPAQAEEPQDTYKALFGDKERYAKDPVLFARELLEAGKSVPDAKPLQALLFQKACEWGSKDAKGLPLAVEALEALAAAQPERKAECDEKLLGILERQYAVAKTPEDRKRVGPAYLAKLMEAADAKAAADDMDGALNLYRKGIPVAGAIGPDQGAALVAKIRALTDRQQAEARREQLEATFRKAKAAVEQNPQDQAATKELQAAARPLAEFLVVEADDAKAAAVVADAGDDEALKAQVTLVAQSVSDLTADHAVALADWLQGISANATDAGKRNALPRVKQAYERFLAIYDKKDVVRLKVTMALEVVTKELAVLPASQRPAGQSPPAPGFAPGPAPIALGPASPPAQPATAPAVPSPPPPADPPTATVQPKGDNKGLFDFSGLRPTTPSAPPSPPTPAAAKKPTVEVVRLVSPLPAAPPAPVTQPTVGAPQASAPALGVAVAASLAGKSGPKDPVPEAMRFQGPPGDGRRGASGLLIAADQKWRQTGTTWSLKYRRSGSAYGIQIFHPLRDGQVIIHLKKDGLGVSNPKSWSQVGYSGGDRKRLSLTDDYQKVFPLQDDATYDMTSHVSTDGRCAIHINGTLVATCRFDAADPISFEIAPGTRVSGARGDNLEFKGEGFPVTWMRGMAGLLIEPLDTGKNIATEIRFAPGYVAASPAPTGHP